MKKYNRLFVLLFVAYLGIAIGLTLRYNQMETKTQNLYQVDVNKIMHIIKNPSDLDTLQLSQYQAIDTVEYLAKDNQDANARSDFYQQPSKQLGVHYVPWQEGNVYYGVLKFTYPIVNTTNIDLLFFMQFCLFVFMLVISMILWFIKQRIIKPFSQISDLPEELSKGNFKTSIQIQKSKYFSNFLWGISQLQDALQVTKKRQLELEKEKKQILLSISHDIKTPLNMIKLYGRALEEDVYALPEDKMHATHQIEVKCNEIEAYVNDIMKHSQEDILDIQVVNGSFYLHDLIQKVLSVYEEPCRLRHLDLSIGPYENRILKGDLHRAQEVIENLFENAFKYGDGQSIQIRFSEEEYCQLIHFYNSGVCVQAQECTHLFDSFYRGSNANGVQGNGLGLYICKSIMRKMDGDIYLETKENGMAFILVFH